MVMTDPRMYRSKTPDFRSLAAKYPQTFGTFVKDDGGYEAKIDFQDAEAVRCLAETLLVEDFGIRARLSDRNLCPMVRALVVFAQLMPSVTDAFGVLGNRLAYIALIHELLSSTLPTLHLLHHHTSQSPFPFSASRISGLDIGTGASAIYPILGVRCFPTWSFVATDIDGESLDYARTHLVSPNKMEDGITLIGVDGNNAFVPWKTNESGATFTMCNPPFYTSREEMDELAGKKKAPANAVCQGTPREMITKGGEVAFVRRMIEESLSIENVLWWTCMLGRLSSVALLGQDLKEKAKEGKMGSWGVKELQTGGGRTKRWVLIWAGRANGLRIPDVSVEEVEWSKRKRENADEKEMFCTAYESGRLAFQQPDDLDTPPLRTGGESAETYQDIFKTSMTAGTGTIEVILKQESWTRKVRRARLHAPHLSENSPPTAHDILPLLMARISVNERTTSSQQSASETGLVVKVTWTYGFDAVRFESFAMFLLAAVQRSVNDSGNDQEQ
ncbi:hypothetical protein PHSY_000425 [Pseudozyma hubeiensis SY62]|uniref:U6 small nuclear RNA (adenine-(43)-N(6))-methyltransferase n=1 Tax=Pseudozyma hubeiensis (strain SY62) TaxID=1305764 RepID=R9NWM5_PSEHS|nr:hypothetical protein PHSY_000425 [Pseudozyma hubeiensis SY62]GAC92867.1 hypothetical protein PHSY_000425 [Pseudozyma hubeiensis SY62]